MQQYVKVIAILSLFRAGFASAQLPDENNRLENDPSKGEECTRGWFEKNPEYTQPWSTWDGKGDWGTLRPLDQRSVNMTSILNCAAECLAAADQFPQRKGENCTAISFARFYGEKTGNCTLYATNPDKITERKWDTAYNSWGIALFDTDCEAYESTSSCCQFSTGDFEYYDNLSRSQPVVQ